MARKLQFQFDDDASELIARYELFVQGKGPGYFDVEELEQIVDYFLRKGKAKESTKALELGLKLHPANLNLQAKRAKIYLAVGETQKALRILESLHDDTEYELQLLKCEAFVKSDNHKSALALSHQIIAAEVEDQDNICLDIAIIFMSNLYFEDAIEFLKKGDFFNSTNVDLLFELAFCYEQLLDSEKAIETYHRIITIDSYLSEAWFNLGQVYFICQEYEKALSAYDFVIAINEEDALAILQKAHTHFQLEQYQKAIDSYQEYSLMANENWQTFLFIGECHEKLEEFDKAIVCYERSLADKADNYDALTGIAVCLLEKELYHESLDYIQQALKLHEEGADAWVYLAEALVGIEDIDNALLAYIKSISIEPDQPETLLAIANICMEKADWSTAQEYYLAAYKLDNTLEFIDLFLAIVYFKNDSLELSKTFFQKAVGRNLDAEALFFEVCPEADSEFFISE